MKLKHIDPEVFQMNKNINFDVSPLYFDYGDKEIYDLLKQNIVQEIFSNKIKVTFKSNYYSHTKHEEQKQNYYHFCFKLINSLTSLEQENLFDFVLSQPNKYFGKIMLENPEVKLTKDQFNKIFYPLINVDYHNYGHILKIALVGNKNIALTEEQVNEGVLKWDSGLCDIFAQRGEKCIHSRTIDILINNENKEGLSNDRVLIELLKHKNLDLNHEQIELLLTHDDFRVKAECARNYQLNFTEEQIQRGLNDEGFEYDGYDDTYSDYNPSDVVNAFLQNPNIKLSKDEVNNIVGGYNEYANLEAFVQKQDLQLDSSQIDTILDKNDRSSALLLQNNNVILNDQQLLTVLYKDKYWAKYVAENYLTRENVTVSEILLSVLKIHPNEEIQKVVAERGDSLLEKNQSTKLKM